MGLAVVAWVGVAGGDGGDGGDGGRGGGGRRWWRRRGVILAKRAWSSCSLRRIALRTRQGSACET